MVAIRTPPWEAICFTQTGQRSGELTANFDHNRRPGKPGRRGLRKQWISPTLKGALCRLLRSISPPTVAVFGSI